jgi:hypothetical protein
VSCWAGADQERLLQPLVRQAGQPLGLPGGLAPLVLEPTPLAAKRTRGDWVFLARPLPTPFGNNTKSSSRFTPALLPALFCT